MWRSVRLPLLALAICLPHYSAATFTVTAGGTTTTGITSPTDLLSTITELLTTGVTAGGTGTTAGTAAAGVAGALALLAAALKAPLVAIYSISAEVVVMVALILFISYIASLLGIDDFRRRTGVPAGEMRSSSIFSNVWNSEIVSSLSERVHNAIDNFDMSELLEKIDTRYQH